MTILPDAINGANAAQDSWPWLMEPASNPSQQILAETVSWTPVRNVTLLSDAQQRAYVALDSLPMALVIALLPQSNLAEMAFLMLVRSAMLRFQVQLDVYRAASVILLLFQLEAGPQVTMHSPSNSPR